MPDWKDPFSTLLDAIPEGAAITDISGTIMELNGAFAVIFGFPEKERIQGGSIYEIFTTHISGAVRSVFGEAMLNGRSGIEYCEVHGAEPFYVELQAVLVRDTSGAATGYILFARDSTGRRSAENALMESEARNRALIEAVPDIMFRVNDSGVYLDKMLGTKISEVFPPEIAKDVVRLISESIKTRTIQIYEYPVTRSGIEEYYEARFVAIEDDEILVILRNVTERRKAMQEIESAKLEAEYANRAKSEFLANMSHEIRTPLNSITGFIELLLRTRLNATQREYLGIIKTGASSLLEIIDGILDFSKIESQKLEINRAEFDPFSEFGSIIRLFNVRAAEKNIKFISFMDPGLPVRIKSDPMRIKQILSNLLSNAIKFTHEGGIISVGISLSMKGDGFCLINFSVSDNGIGIPLRKQTKIFEPFSQADSSITRSYGGTGLGLSICSNLVRLLGSEIVLESSPGVGSKFYFTLETETSGDETYADTVRAVTPPAVCIVTKDRGDISVRNLENYILAFNCDLFYWDYSGPLPDRDFDVIIYDMPGSVSWDVSSIKRKPWCRVFILDDDRAGAASSDELPAYESLSHPFTPEVIYGILFGINSTPSSPGNIHAECESAPAGYSGRVLVGEDNRINQKLMTLLLKDYGLDVEIASNGIDVFDRFKNGNFDLVFMDVSMPVADGLETTRMIIEYELEKGLVHTPIIALTARAIVGDSDIAFKSGMDGYLTKPVEMGKLESVFSSYLKPVPARADCSGESGRSDESIAACADGFDFRSAAAELKIPASVLLNIGREFFEEAFEVIGEIRSSIESGSYKEMGALSHKLKGASANLRFVRLAGLLSEFEENSALGNKEFDYYKLLYDVEGEMKILKELF